MTHLSHFLFMILVLKFYVSVKNKMIHEFCYQFLWESIQLPTQSSHSDKTQLWTGLPLHYRQLCAEYPLQLNVFTRDQLIFQSIRRELTTVLNFYSNLSNLILTFIVEKVNHQDCRDGNQKTFSMSCFKKNGDMN